MRGKHQAAQESERGDGGIAGVVRGMPGCYFNSGGGQRVV